MESSVIVTNIDNFCKDHGISRAEFERQCGLSNGMVSSWAKGRYSSGLRSIEKISRKTKIPMGKWLTEGGVKCRKSA